MTESEIPETIGAETDRGYNMQILSGKAFFPLDPRPEDIRIWDIAHALSLQCRFNGHCKEFYSVAQHCVLAARWIEDRELAFQALMHDAAEAYIGDVIRPLKPYMSEYFDIEARIQGVINAKYGLPEKFDPKVKECDNRMAWTEKRDILNPPIGVDWGPPFKPYPLPIICWTPDIARMNFMNEFTNLGGRE